MLPANFNQLYYFWAIVKAGSISAAAKRLLLNQSTLSVQMRQLEAALETTLLLRGRHGVTPTDAGKLALDYCEVIFGEAEELLVRLRKRRAGTQIRFGASESLSRGRVFEIIQHIRTHQPGTSVRVFTGSTEDLQSRLERHRLDLAVSDVDLAARMSNDFRSRLVSSTELHFLASPEIKRRMRAFPSGLNGVPLLLRAPGNPVRKDVEHYLHRRSITPDIQAEVEDSDLILLMAIQGQGVGIFDAAAARDALDSGLLVRLHKRPVQIRERIWFVCRRNQSARAGIHPALKDIMEKFTFKGEAAGHR